jgi:hypothetical protein
METRTARSVGGGRGTNRPSPGYVGHVCSVGAGRRRWSSAVMVAGRSSVSFDTDERSRWTVVACRLPAGCRLPIGCRLVHRHRRCRHVVIVMSLSSCVCVVHVCVTVCVTVCHVITHSVIVVSLTQSSLTHSLTQSVVVCVVVCVVSTAPCLTVDRHPHPSHRLTSTL